MLNGISAVRGRVDAKWGVLFALGVASFVSAMSASVVFVILPIIGRDFGADVATIEWVLTIYVLITSSLMLSFGRLGDMSGHSRVYNTGQVLFVLGAAHCGLAPTIETLIAARGLQALGASMTVATSPAILTNAFPASQRGQVLGMNITLTYLGLTFGPLIGGWLTSQWGWRAIFAVTVPFMVLALLLCLRFLPPDKRVERRGRFDFAGAVTFSAALVTILVALNRGHDWGWSSPAVVGLLAGGAGLLGVFVWLESRSASPMLDLRLFRSRTFTAGTVSALCHYSSVFALQFLLPFYLTQGRGLGPAEAGLILMAQPIVMAPIALVSGTLSDRVGSRVLATAGMAILAIGLFVLSRLGPESPLIHVVLGLLIAGLGSGLFTSPNNSALLGSAPPHQRGIASAIASTARNVGQVLGVGLAGAILSTVLAHGGSGDAAVAEAVDITFLVTTVIVIAGAIAASLRESGATTTQPG